MAMAQASSRGAREGLQAVVATAASEAAEGVEASPVVREAVAVAMVEEVGRMAATAAPMALVQLGVWEACTEAWCVLRTRTSFGG